MRDAAVQDPSTTSRRPSLRDRMTAHCTTVGHDWLVARLSVEGLAALGRVSSLVLWPLFLPLRLLGATARPLRRVIVARLDGTGRPPRTQA